jgi:hypothetical protein
MSLPLHTVYILPQCVQVLPPVLPILNRLCTWSAYKTNATHCLKIIFFMNMTPSCLVDRYQHSEKSVFSFIQNVCTCLSLPDYTLSHHGRQQLHIYRCEHPQNFYTLLYLFSLLVLLYRHRKLFWNKERIFKVFFNFSL